MNFLGIDFGTKRIGIALSFGNIADPLMILKNDASAIDHIAALVQQHQIDELVFGVSEGAMAQQTQAFAKLLQQKLAKKVHFFDETLSSKEVEHMIRLSGKKQKARQAPIDHYAAAHILQQFLDGYLHG